MHVFEQVPEHGEALEGAHALKLLQLRQLAADDVLAQLAARRQLVELVEELDALLVTLRVLHGQLLPDTLAYHLQ